jgi:cytochrome c oxidase assembly protein subunit 11
MTNFPSQPQYRRDIIVAAVCGFLVAGLVGASYAAVPFYNWFCRVTGYGGTPQVATAAPSHVIDREVTVRFDSNVAPGLPWRFEPEQNSIRIKLGEVATVHYRVTNQAARPITAQAGYNVAPLVIGSYFQKINCFCFTEQRLKAGETREMTVVFYVDPKMITDTDGATVDTITLSYTFYQVRDSSRPVADSRPAKRQDGPI